MLENLKIKISPSILSADFGKLNAEIANVDSDADIIHVDIMDGHFVPNLSFGMPVVKWIKSKKPLDVHFMVENIEDYIETVPENINRVIFHLDSCKTSAKDVLELFKKRGFGVGVAIAPKDDIEDAFYLLDELDCMLILTVKPGFGGQKFMEENLLKVAKLREKGFNKDIIIDGGINGQTYKKAIDAGANVLVSGSYIFKSNDRKAAIASLKV